MKIVLIGAGSFVFAPTVVHDALHVCGLDNFEFAFVDVNARSVNLMAGVAKKIAETLGLNVAVSASTDRKRALEGADYVITSVAAEGAARWNTDYAIGEREGVSDLLRECGALGGISYGCRSISLLMSICGDIGRICPKAVHLNVSNPLTKVHTAIHRFTSITSYGFCDVAGGGPRGNEMVARYLGREPCEIEVVTAGINHFAWILGVRDRLTGEDLLRKLLDAVALGTDGFSASMRDMYERFGAFPAAIHHHMEFLPTAPYTAKIDAPPFHGSGEEREARLAELERIANGELLYTDAKLFSNGSWEHPALVAAAIFRKEDFYQPMLNVVNDGCLSQFPHGNIVEVPVTVTGGVVVPKRGLSLPQKAAEVTVLQSEIAEMTARAAFFGDRKLAHEVVDADPAIDRKKSAHRALDGMIDAHLDLMPQFRS